MMLVLFYVQVQQPGPEVPLWWAVAHVPRFFDEPYEAAVLRRKSMLLVPTELPVQKKTESLASLATLFRFFVCDSSKGARG